MRAPRPEQRRGPDGAGDVFDQRVRCALDTLQIQRAVETALRDKWLDVRAETEHTGMIVRCFYQVVEILQSGAATMMLNHAPSPVIGHGIPNRPEEATHSGGFESPTTSRVL